MEMDGRSSMYGDNDQDPVIKYYDLSFAVSAERDKNWYINKVKSIGGPILDLACGTGRLSIAFARLGYDVTSIDDSDGMLNRFRHNLNKESAEVKEKIQISKQRMQNFNLDKTFQLVICCSAFFHNTTIEEQKDCLRSVHECLKNDGYFIFNIRNHPDPKFLAKASRPQASTYNECGRFPLTETNETLIVEQALFHNLSEQTFESKLRFIKKKQDEIIEKTESSWKTRYTCKYEMQHLLELAGFRIETIVGDFEDGPIQEGSQLIYTCRKKRN